MTMWRTRHRSAVRTRRKRAAMRVVAGGAALLGMGAVAVHGAEVRTADLRDAALAARVEGADGGQPSAWIACRDGSSAPSAHTDYYAIELVPTRNVTGTAFVDGRAEVTFRSSPFGVSIGADGSYVQDVHVRLDRLRAPAAGQEWVAWVTTTELDHIERLGALDAGGRVSGPVSWNKFLVVVTLEPAQPPADGIEPRTAAARRAPANQGADSSAAYDFAWRGPVAFRGMSRSGKMHTMVGHGPLQDENCAAYGFSR